MKLPAEALAYIYSRLPLIWTPLSWSFGYAEQHGYVCLVFRGPNAKKKKDLLKVNLLTRTLLLRRTFVVTATTYVWQGIRATQGKVKKKERKKTRQQQKCICVFVPRNKRAREARKKYPRMKPLLLPPPTCRACGKAKEKKTKRARSIRADHAHIGLAKKTKMGGKEKKSKQDVATEALLLMPSLSGSVWGCVTSTTAIGRGVSDSPLCVCLARRATCCV